MPRRKRHSDYLDEISEAHKQFFASHPYGLTKADLNFDLNPNDVAANYDEIKYGDDIPAIYDRVIAKIKAKNAKLIKTNQCLDDDEFTAKWLREHGHDLHVQYLADLPLPELMAFSFCMRWSGQFTREAEDTPLLWYVRKLELSAWHWGWNDFNWPTLCKYHEMIKAFDFGIEDFEVTLTHTRGTNERGSSEYYPEPVPGDDSWFTWIDSELAFLVHYKGKHVLTISFAATGHGILLQQVQLKNKKGNRWLYKLTDSLLDHVLLCFAAASDLPIWLVSGEAAAEWVYRQKRPEDRDKPEWLETKQRIIALYNGQLKMFKRVDCDKRNAAKEYWLVEPVPQVLGMAV